MSLSRDVLRTQAKKIYKEQVKGIPKRQRLPFAKFYKQFAKMQKNPNVEEAAPVDQDFDFKDMVNVNTVDDGDLEFDTDTSAETEATEQSSEEE